MCYLFNFHNNPKKGVLLSFYRKGITPFSVKSFKLPKAYCFFLHMVFNISTRKMHCIILIICLQVAPSPPPTALERELLEGKGGTLLSTCL